MKPKFKVGDIVINKYTPSYKSEILEVEVFGARYLIKPDKNNRDNDQKDYHMSWEVFERISILEQIADSPLFLAMNEK